MGCRLSDTCRLPSAGRRISLSCRQPPSAALSSPALRASRLGRLLVAGRRWVVLAMLLAMHLALVSEPGGIFQRLWLLVHFGLFLLWQPFFATERELELFWIAMLVAFVVATLYLVSGWAIVMWLLLLIGIFGGRVFTVHSGRRSRFYLVAFAYVLAVMLLWAVPVLVLEGQHIPPHVATFAQAWLPLLLLLLLAMPLPEEADSGQVFDFFYAVLVFQLGVVLVLGSIVTMRYTNEDYVASVALTVLGFGLALFVFAVLWNPMRGFGGLRTYFSAYLLSVGMPFELWMRRIAELAEIEADAGRFLEQALREIAALPWMRGASWRSPDGDGRFGLADGFATRFQHEALEVVFHTRIQLSPALFLHMRLLSQVVGEFYEGKRRETVLRRHAYLQAVHETGARLTHDVKNLLQSIYALTSVAPRESPDPYIGLLQRQLPQLSRRLQATLEKLRSPEVAASEMSVKARSWWAETERRLGGGGVRLAPAIADDRDVPAGLFDSFLENALENARAKGADGKEPEISVGLTVDSGRCELRVCDRGEAVPEAVALRLFREPIERAGGLGIGLYHLARQARAAGYELVLAENRAGAVCFALRSEAAAPSSAAVA